VDEAFFWRLAEDSHADAGPDTERAAQALLRRLRTLRTNAVERFEELWKQAQDELYCWPVLDAATLLLGPLDDELAVQDWIVSHGRRAVRGVLDDPDSLVAFAPDRHNARIDWFCGLPLGHTSPPPGFRSRSTVLEDVTSHGERRPT
jgi:hypothetical protein